MKSTVVLTTGVAGTGKTYRRAAVEIFRFLLEENGNYWSNFPFYADRIARECSQRTGKPAEYYLRRLKAFPKAELDSWELSFDRQYAHKSRGPFTYFKPIPYELWQSGDTSKLPHGWAGKDYPDTVVKFIDEKGQPMAGIDLTGAHIAIDECHNFCKASGSTPKHQRELWGAWLGEIRHIGATVEFLTQSPHKLAKEIVNEAEVRIDLLNVEAERDPFFKIKMADWYELKASISGRYEAKVQMLEKRCIDGRWTNQHSEFFTRDPFYFQFYNSYNKPQAGGVNTGGKLHEFQKRTKLSLFGWFVKRNLWSFGSRIGLTIFVMWVCFMGGGKILFNQFVGGLRQITNANTVAPETEQQKPTLPPTSTATSPQNTPVKKVANVTPPQAPASLQPGSKEASPVIVKPKCFIVMLTPNSVSFNDRNVYAIGETIGAGPLKGQRILSIDFKRRRLYTNKTVVLLGQIITYEKEKPENDNETKQSNDSISSYDLHVN